MTPVEPTRTPTGFTAPRDTGESPLVRVMLEVRGRRVAQRERMARMSRRSNWKTLWRDSVAEASKAMQERDEANRKLAEIRYLADSWRVPDDVYLHLDGQDLGYADAAVQLLAILDREETP